TSLPSASTDETRWGKAAPSTAVRRPTPSAASGPRSVTQTAGRASGSAIINPGRSSPATVACTWHRDTAVPSATRGTSLEGGVAQPVLPRRVGEHDLGRTLVDGERRQGAESGGVHQSRLGVALVALAPTATGHLDLGGVVHLASGLVEVETLVQPAPHEAARLRRAVGDDVVVAVLVPQEGAGVAERQQAGARDRADPGRVDDLVVDVGLDRDPQ